jgi:hypothetical protein
MSQGFRLLSNLQNHSKSGFRFNRTGRMICYQFVISKKPRSGDREILPTFVKISHRYVVGNDK